MRVSILPRLVAASGGKLALGIIFADVVVQKINEELCANMNKVCERTKKNYKKSTLLEELRIKAVRDTYQALGKSKISKFKPSNESMIRRILSGKGLYQINTVVDVNNLVSVKYARSIGSYNASALSGDVVFSVGDEGQTYTGTTKRPVELHNLPVLTDDLGPFGSPTSDSSRTLISEETTRVMSVVFSFDGEDNLQSEIDEMAELFREYAGANILGCGVISGSQSMRLGEDGTCQIIKDSVADAESASLFQSPSVTTSASTTTATTATTTTATTTTVAEVQADAGAAAGDCDHDESQAETAVGLQNS